MLRLRSECLNLTQKCVFFLKTAEALGVAQVQNITNEII